MRTLVLGSMVVFAALCTTACHSAPVVPKAKSPAPNYTGEMIYIPAGVR